MATRAWTIAARTTLCGRNVSSRRGRILTGAPNSVSSPMPKRHHSTGTNTNDLEHSEATVELPVYTYRKPSTLISKATKRQRDLDSKLEAMVRVDHAGEHGAVRILQGQLSVLKGTDAEPEIRRMLKEEEGHFSAFQKILPQHRVRPTAMMPVWDVLGYALGAGTAMMGKEAAMACTVAVEEVIAEHYNDQLRTLHEIDKEEYSDLKQYVKKFRDDEIGHMETGLEHDAEQAPAYKLLTNVIGVGCKAAIWLSSRV